MKQKTQYIEDNLLSPAFSKNNTAIFFNSDDKYAPYLATTINSLVRNSSDQFNYDLIVLTEDMTDNNICMLKTVVKQKTNFSLRFFNIHAYDKSPHVTSFAINTEHLSSSAYYRIFAPWIFRNYNEIIYLDCDLIVNADIAELMHIPFENKAVIAVADYYITESHSSKAEVEFLKYAKQILKIEDMTTYFNSGVMILNLKKIRKKYTVDQFIETAKINNYRYNDQNVLNSVLYGDAKLIESEWNFQNPFNMHSNLFAKYGRPIDKLKIIHFCTHVKPWHDINLRFADIWWCYARETMFYERMLLDMVKSGCLAGMLQDGRERPKMSDEDIEGIIRTVLDKHESQKKDENIEEIALAFLRRRYWKYRILSRITFGRTKNRYIQKEAAYLKRLKEMTDD